MERGSTNIEQKSVGTSGGNDEIDPESYDREAMECASSPEKNDDVDNAYDDSEWENGSIPSLSSMKDVQEDLVDGVSVEFDVSDGLTKRKPVRRATAEEKVDLQL